MTKLSVNVNKLATLRNARGKNNPDVVKTSLDLIRFGAQGITVHPRPDGRHIRTADVLELSRAVDVEFNIEGYPSEDFLALVTKVKPAQCTLVPDPPEVLTSNAGWKIRQNEALLKPVLRRLGENGIRVSVFADPADCRADDLRCLKDLGGDRIELYTEAFAENFWTPERDRVTGEYLRAAELARDLGLGVNAGHDLNLDNLAYLKEKIPFLAEVSIGHAFICDALYLGFAETTRRYLGCLNQN